MADWAPPAPAVEEREASALLFPEARTMEIPPLAAAMTALLRAVDTPPPRDIYVAGAVARAVAGGEVDTGDDASVASGSGTREDLYVNDGGSGGSTVGLATDDTSDMGSVTVAVGSTGLVADGGEAAGFSVGELVAVLDIAV